MHHAGEPVGQAGGQLSAAADRHLALLVLNEEHLDPTAEFVPRVPDLRLAGEAAVLVRHEQVPGESGNLFGCDGDFAFAFELVAFQADEDAPGFESRDLLQLHVGAEIGDAFFVPELQLAASDAEQIDDHGAAAGDVTLLAEQHDDGAALDGKAFRKLVRRDRRFAGETAAGVADVAFDWLKTRDREIERAAALEMVLFDHEIEDAVAEALIVEGDVLALATQLAVRHRQGNGAFGDLQARDRRSEFGGGKGQLAAELALGDVERGSRALEIVGRQIDGAFARGHAVFERDAEITRGQALVLEGDLAAAIELPAGDSNSDRCLRHLELWNAGRLELVRLDRRFGGDLALLERHLDFRIVQRRNVEVGLHLERRLAVLVDLDDWSGLARELHEWNGGLRRDPALLDLAVRAIQLQRQILQLQSRHRHRREILRVPSFVLRLVDIFLFDLQIPETDDEETAAIGTGWRRRRRRFDNRLPLDDRRPRGLKGRSRNRRDRTRPHAAHHVARRPFRLLLERVVGRHDSRRGLCARAAAALLDGVRQLVCEETLPLWRLRLERALAKEDVLPGRERPRAEAPRGVARGAIGVHADVRKTRRTILPSGPGPACRAAARHWAAPSGQRPVARAGLRRRERCTVLVAVRPLE